MQLGRGTNITADQKKDQAWSKYTALKADDLTKPIPVLIHQWIEVVQKAVAAGNTALKEVNQEASRLAKLMKKNVDKALTIVSAKRQEVIKQGKNLLRNNSQEPYPTQAEYLMLTEYQKILAEYLTEVGTGTLKVNLYDQENGILCPQTVHPWLYLFVKFSEYERNAIQRDWRVIWSTDLNRRAEYESKSESGSKRSTRGTKRSTEKLN